MANDPLHDEILDAALDLAETHGWEAVRFHQVAAVLNIALSDIHRYFREKEDLADAWFDRADRAMLEDAARHDYALLVPRDRLERSILAWLNALEPRRRVTREIILNKCEPGHLHVQLPALLRISRTVQWLREAAGRDAAFHRRALEETVLTTLFVTTFIAWLGDRSVEHARTRRLLGRLLDTARWGATLLPAFLYPRM